MELRQLRYAVTLSETLHFRRAAEREFITQSALSQQIARLEAELDVRLFDRSSHHVRVTPAGELLIARARELLEQAESLRTDVVDAAAGVHGSLRVGLFAHAAAELTPLILSSAVSALPRTRLVIRELTLIDQFDQLLDGEVDVALLNPPVDSDALTVHTLYHEPRCAMVPRSHPLADAPVLRTADLVDEPFAVTAPGLPERWRSFWGLFDERGGPSPRDVEITNLSEVLFAVACHGAVVTFPSSGLRFRSHPGATAMPLVDAAPAALAVVTRARERRPEVHAFVEVARDVARRHIDTVPDAVLAGDQLG